MIIFKHKIIKPKQNEKKGIFFRKEWSVDLSIMFNFVKVEDTPPLLPSKQKTFVQHLCNAAEHRRR